MDRKTQKERQVRPPPPMARRGVYARRHIGFQIKIWETGKREAALMTSSETLDPVGPEASSFLFLFKFYLFVFA